MNVLGLMVRALVGALGDEVTQVLDGISMTGSPPEKPDAAEPTEAADASVPAGERDAEESDSAVEPEASETSMVDAVFQGTAAQEPPATAEACEPSAAMGGTTAEGDEPDESEQRPSPDPTPQADGEQEAEAGRQAEPMGEVSAAQVEVVRNLLRERGKPLRGYEIAEGTGIAPWWRLKDILELLIREGQVVQDEEGLFSLTSESGD